MSEAKIQLLGVLGEATSQDYQRMKAAEDMLKQWENAPSFFATLQVHSLNPFLRKTRPDELVAYLSLMCVLMETVGYLL